MLVGAALLLAVEVWLHTDAFLYRYRSVFAAGRALDKTGYAERHCPHLLIIGNSRADNGFDPRVIDRESRVPLQGSIFNLGIPGADSRVMAGIMERVDAAGCLRPHGVRYVVLALDEALVQSIDSLGQEVFFARVADLWTDGQYQDAFRAVFRLYGYSANLRQLREPATLQRFIRASREDVDPVGGGAAEHLGYRAGFGGLQDAQAAVRQEGGSILPPDETNVRHLWRMLDRLSSRGVQVAVVFPPLLNRDVRYVADAGSAGSPFLAIADELRRRGIPLISLDSGLPRDPSEFVNAGHLNDRGARRYSALLARALNGIWGGVATPAARPRQPAGAS